MLHCNACTLSALKNSPAAGRSGGGACALAGAGPYADELRAQWPLPLPGCHRLLLAEGRITLDLWFGDVNELLPQFDASMNNQVDAWFLDGFAPAKNPDMWTEQLFAAMARFARPEGSFATFTAAGFVRRGLQQAGFQVNRCKASAKNVRCSPAVCRPIRSLHPTRRPGIGVRRRTTPPTSP